MPQIEAATAYTIFVPTNRSLEARGNGSSLVRPLGWGRCRGRVKTRREPPIPGQRDKAGGLYRPGRWAVPRAPELLRWLPCQDEDTVRHHVILGEALSAEALQRGGHRNSLLGPAHWLVFYNHSGQVCRGGGPRACNLCSRDHPSSETLSLPRPPASLQPQGEWVVVLGSGLNLPQHSSA